MTCHFDFTTAGGAAVVEIIEDQGAGVNNVLLSVPLPNGSTNEFGSISICAPLVLNYVYTGQVRTPAAATFVHFTVTN
jgi:hypothetical protein